MMRKLDEAGFSVVETGLIVVIVAILGFAGWFVWHSQKAANKTLSDANKSAPAQTAKKVSTFAECKAAAGSKMLETYPEQCVTKDGKSFTNTSSSAVNYLEIKELGVKIPLSANVKDAYYDMGTASDGEVYANLRVHSLDSELNCKNGDASVATLSKISTKDVIKGQDQGNTPTGGTTIGGYYYFINLAQYPCNENAANDSTLSSVRQEFRAVSPKIEAL